MHGQFVAETRNRMSTANATRTEGHRARTGGQIKLASLLMTTGDPAEAAALGIQALDGAGILDSQRTTHKLRELRRSANPTPTSPRSPNSTTASAPRSSSDVNLRQASRCPGTALPECGAPTHHYRARLQR